MILWKQVNEEALVQLRLYWRVLQSSATSSEENGSKRWKVSKSGPAESNETTPWYEITCQEFFF